MTAEPPPGQGVVRRRPPPEVGPEPVRRLMRYFGTARGARRLRLLIVVLLVVSVVALIGRGGSRPADPYVADATPTPVRALPGFGAVTLTVSTSSGTEVLCAADAATQDQRAVGLMGRTDLGGYDVMVFRFPADTTTSFYMRNTPIPLSIAWYDGRGRFVSGTTMDPCPDRMGCPDYTAAGPYRFAVEAPEGALARFGVVAGSSATVGPAGCST